MCICMNLMSLFVVAVLTFPVHITQFTKEKYGCDVHPCTVWK